MEWLNCEVIKQRENNIRRLVTVIRGGFQYASKIESTLSGASKA